jgi:predicted dehydrogenase
MAVRLGVVGLGKMGQHHVRCARRARGVELVATTDSDPAAASQLEDPATFVADFDEFLERCDAVVLAIPTNRHVDVGVRILEADRHLLVEKPLARTTDECNALVRVATERNRVLCVGHVERLNGAYRAVAGKIRAPRFAEGHRLAAFDPRGTEVDVVLDLMIHDLDLILDVFQAEPIRVDAVGVAVLTDRIDIANVRLEFPNGSLANLTASRVSRTAVRKLRLFQEDAYLSLDFQTQTAEIYSRDPNAKPWGVSRESIDADEEHNPLVAEHEQFVAAIRGEASTLPSANDGVRAVRLAERVRESIEERRAQWGAAGVGAGPWADVPS